MNILESLKSKGIGIFSFSKHHTLLILAITFPCILLLFSVLLFASSHPTVSAAPSPPSSPITLSTYTYSPTVDFHFTSSELTSSTFKQKQLGVAIETNNPTGVTSYFSSIDEDTNLNHTDSAITQKINSITTPLLSTAFSPKTWDYQVVQLGPLSDIFSPIPKVSTPDTVFTMPSADQTKYFVKFGVKASPDLTPGTYSKQVLFTTVTNHVPTTAKFLPGSTFNTTINGLNANYDTENFKKSTTPPPNPATATIVSTTDSEQPIYAWYDTPSKTIYWWSDADTVYANEDSSRMFNYEGINNQDYIIDVEGIDTSRVVDMSLMFSCIKTGSIKEIRNLDKLNTSKVEDMSGMFRCVSPNLHIKTLDVSKFNTSKVKNMSAMFAGQSELESISISNFDTAQVTDMQSMFEHNSKITDLDLSNFDTRNVRNMSSMFSYMSGLKRLEISNFNTGNVEDMSSMFSHSSSLKNLSILNFNTSKVKDMSEMFMDSSIEKLDLSSFDTSEVLKMNYMFDHMSRLEELNVSSFNTQKTTEMSAMFRNLLVVKTLDVSSFDTRNVIRMHQMFYNCKLLSKIEASDTFKVDSLYDSEYDMFRWSTKLVGGNGTVYDPLKIDKEYARIDKNGTPGYFTQKP